MTKDLKELESFILETLKNKNPKGGIVYNPYRHIEDKINVECGNFYGSPLYSVEEFAKRLQREEKFSGKILNFFTERVVSDEYDDSVQCGYSISRRWSKWSGWLFWIAFAGGAYAFFKSPLVK